MSRIKIEPLPEPTQAKLPGPPSTPSQAVQPAPSAPPSAARPDGGRSARRGKWFLIGAAVAVVAGIVAFLPERIDGSTTCSRHEIQWRYDEMRMRHIGSSTWGEWTYRGEMDRDAMCRVADASR
jgi:hypothetical protein